MPNRFLFRLSSETSTFTEQRVHPAWLYVPLQAICWINVCVWVKKTSLLTTYLILPLLFQHSPLEKKYKTQSTLSKFIHGGIQQAKYDDMVIWLSPMYHSSALCIGAAYKNLTACSNPSAVWLFRKEMRTDNLVVSGFLLIQTELFTLPLGHKGLTHLQLREWTSTDSRSSGRSQTYWVSFSHIGMRVGI